MTLINSRIKSLSSIFLLILFTLSLVGCGGSDTSSSSSSLTPSNNATAVTYTDFSGVSRCISSSTYGLNTFCSTTTYTNCRTYYASTCANLGY